MKKSIIGLFSILVCVIYCSALAINISAKNNQKYSETSSYAMMVSDLNNMVLVDDALACSYTKTNSLFVGNTRGLFEPSYIELHNVYTTNNTKVTCAIRYLADYTEEEAEKCRREFMEKHPTFEEKDTDSGLATSQFNCHAYAWYNASIDDPCWIRYPDEFIEDPHCIPVTDGINVQVGDIVVFVYGDDNIHSAVVDSFVYINGQREIICSSKFDAEGIYLHKIDKTADVYDYDYYEFYRYVQDEHLIRYNTIDESQHYLDCRAEDCNYYELHDTTVSFVNDGLHKFDCNECNYSVYSEHELYTSCLNDGDYRVKCRDCSYTVECSEAPEFIDGDETGHWVDCTCGCYSFFEEHSYNYLQLPPSNSNRLYYHKATCSVCTGTHNLPHNWVSVGGVVECTDCGLESEFGGVENIMNLSEEELSLLLSSMSDEELAEFVASLPEDALARVTAILPPANDDELLTE